MHVRWGKGGGGEGLFSRYDEDATANGHVVGEGTSNLAENGRNNFVHACFVGEEGAGDAAAG